jgi:cytochrome c biogenesis protein
VTATQTPLRPAYRDLAARRFFAFVRNTWRGLTSMRTALFLLFLLALAAMPGALLPQRALNAPKTDQYIADHGWWGTLLDRLQFFNVYSSIWFSAVYLLLMVSLVGCLAPRSLDYVRSVRAKPVLTPRNLSRMPHFREAHRAASPDEVCEAARARLKGWRTVERVEDGGVRTISAERGYLRETGNLVFHFAMLGLIIAFALGKLYSYEGQVIVQADGSSFCNSGIYNYDSFNPGLRVDGTNLDPFCVRIDDFAAQYTPDNQPVAYRSHIDYQSGADLQNNVWKPYLLEVNSPLRTAGDRLYLLGNGYSPIFTVTYPNGEKRTQKIQWATTDATTHLAEGATKFDPPGVTDPVERRTRELAITGILAPTSAIHGGVLTSVAPQLDNPMVAVDVLRGGRRPTQAGGPRESRGEPVHHPRRRHEGQLRRRRTVGLPPGLPRSDPGVRARLRDRDAARARCVVADQEASRVDSGEPCGFRRRRYGGAGGRPGAHRSGGVWRRIQSNSG